MPALGAKDMEIASWLIVQPAGLCHAEIAKECAVRFGSDAWGEDRIRATLVSLPRKGGAMPMAMRNAEVLAFVNARIGTMTFSALAEECRKRFGDKAPSRSSLHRYAHRIGGLKRTLNRQLNGL